MDPTMMLGLSKITISMSKIFIITAIIALIFSYFEKNETRSKGLLDLGLLAIANAGVFWAINKLFL